MARVEFGGDPNNLNYRTSYTGNYLYSDYGSGWPTGNPSSDGGAPVIVYAAGADWQTGATYVDIVYLGGSSFRIRVGHGAGTLGAGRNTGNGATMVDSADGDTVTGGICGYFDWYTVPGAPYMIEATPGPAGSMYVRFGGTTDGGTGVDRWDLQYATNSGFTAGVVTITSNGTSSLNLTPGVTYWFRSRGHNAAGNGAWSGSMSATARGGPRRFDGVNGWAGASWMRWNGTAWVQVVNWKRWNGTAWVELT